MLDWAEYCELNVRLNDGFFLIQIVDGVLDPENWPVDAIVIKTGVVVRQTDAYRSNEVVYKMPNFVGMDEKELRLFINQHTNAYDYPEKQSYYIKEV